ncbi:MAG: 16S rRNA (guanine(966)-N(2))-methyltransferase RsmD [Clostridia bacterium]|nr:16S rRNA (guanine(966)-N(2))-methyltransferase RsmD [Clostridia bacterium]
MRIIAGKYRGRTLSSFQGDNIRPTPDRVKESLFQILSGKLSGARVLDLFAGSGALGIECLSRGASEAVFNDSSRESLSVLEKNLRLVKEGAKPYNLDFRTLLARVEGQFDLIFCDPPYKENYLKEILDTVRTRNLLSADGLVVYESEREEMGAEGWILADCRKYGRTNISMWKL